MSQQIVAVEDRVPDISNKQLVTITENFRLLSNTLDFVQQAIQEVKEREKREAEAKAEEEAKKKAEEEAARRVQPPPAVEHPGSHWIPPLQYLETLDQDIRGHHLGQPLPPHLPHRSHKSDPKRGRYCVWM